MTLRSAIGDVSAQFALDANALGNLKQQAKSDPKQALSMAAGQFEALFMQMLLKSMRQALPQDGALSSETSKTYTSMFDQQIAQQLSKKGIGVADMLVKQLSGALPQKDTSAGTATALPVTDRIRSMLAPRTPAQVPGPTRPTGKEPPGPNRPPPKDPPGPPGPTRPTPKVALAPTESTGSVAATVQGFIDKLRPYAEAVAEKLGVPAQYLIAQAGLETGWGKSQPHTADGAPSNNLFGIKATTAWKGPTVTTGTSEYVAGQMEKTTASFRAYGSYTDSFQDFAKLLQKSRRYANALANTHDAGKYATSLQQAGYATDPRYAEKLTRAIQTVARYAPATPAATQVVAAPADKRRDLA